jgi:hypothetical protein
MIPIFIITRDRITVLKQCIESYLKLGDVKIVLLDNGSTYPPMVDFLNSGQYEVIKNLNPNGSFNDISEWVGRVIMNYPNPEDFYIVTDPDILLEYPSPELLEYYKWVLSAFSGAVCVGPMLRIDDLPECFHFKDQMIHSHMQQFWDEKINPRIDFRNVLIQWAWIDTTFAMYRKGFKFRRLNHGIRVHNPYYAKHLDWYMDTLNLTEEQLYYKEHASDISTMSMHLRKGGMG